MTPFKRLVQILTLRCEGASLLTSSAMDEDLDFADRLALAGHLLACARCRNFRDQMGILRDLARSVGTGDASLTPEAKDRMQTAVRDVIGRHDAGESAGEEEDSN